MTVFVRRNAMNPHTLAQATGQTVDPKSGKRIEKLAGPDHLSAVTARKSQP